MQKILDMFRKRRNDIRKPIDMDKRVVIQIAQEELAELIQAISKMNRATMYWEKQMKRIPRSKEEDRDINIKLSMIERLRNKKFKDNLCEEMADVIIALSWVMDVYGVEDKDVAWYINMKANRMTKRIKEGEFY